MPPNSLTIKGSWINSILLLFNATYRDLEKLEFHVNEFTISIIRLYVGYIK